MDISVTQSVKDRYAAGARERQEELCCPVEYDGKYLEAIPEEVLARDYGCGDPSRFLAPGDTVLDLGSGTGKICFIASQIVGPEGRVIGVDMTDEMVERGRANIADAGVANVEIKKGIIEQLPVEDASVDVVISNCVINLSPEKERVFAEIARVLAPGGRMVVSDIVMSGIPE